MDAIEWQYIFNPELALESLPYLLRGVPYTLGIALVSTAIGMVIGMIIALMRLSPSRALRWTARLYVSFMRGTPVLVFLFLIYFGLPFINIQFNALTSAIICFSLNGAAYISEIFRSSISSVDRGQWEASAVLRMSPYITLKDIILPQAFRIAIPPLSSVLLDVIKGTSLAAMITVNEIFQNARVVGGREHDYMTMYILVAAIYWVICSLFGVLQDYLETVSSRYITK
ncbi:amino acid ABC transporter permease [Alkalibacterium psychrotolerans]